MTKKKPDPNPRSDKKASHQTDWSFWKPLLVVTSIYCIAAFSATAAAYTVHSDWLLLPILAIVFSQSQITSIFAALGPGSYWKRLMITQGCSFFVAMCVLGGLSMTIDEGPHYPIRNSMAGVFVIGSVVSQFAYGILRLTLGWRFHTKSTQRGTSYNLQDLFALTLYLGVALSMLNTTLLAPVRNGQISTECIAVVVAFLLGMIFYGLPTLWTTFRMPRKSDQGCFAQPIIIVFVGFFIILPFVAMGAPSTVVGPLVLFLCGCSLFTALPLSQMQDRGFLLSDGKESNGQGTL